MMIPANLFSELKELDRVGKLQVMQFLVAELARDEGIDLKSGVEYPIWSPHNAHKAARTLRDLLSSDTDTPPNG